MQLELANVNAGYAKERILHQVSLRVESGQIVALLGPSGCGKTTVLRCIAGFEPVQEGEISIAGQRVSGFTEHVAPEARSVGMVFQDYALLPHLTALENIMFGLHQHGAAERKTKATEFLGLVGLKDFPNAYPSELSGGEQQRVALARALAPGPRLLLMDEPFSNLDTDMRERLSIEVREIIRSLSITTLLVTHDQREAFTFADEVAVINQGRVQQVATPLVLYHQPANEFVASFVGAGSFIRGTMRNGAQVETALGALAVDREFKTGASVRVLVRPEDLHLNDPAGIEVELVGKTFVGRDYLLSLRLPTGEVVQCYQPVTGNADIPQLTKVRYASKKAIVFKA